MLVSFKSYKQLQQYGITRENTVTNCQRPLTTTFLIFYIGLSLIAGCSFIQEPRPMTPPEKSNWTPKGPRNTGVFNPILGSYDTMRGLHGDTVNSDEILGVTAPMFELDWVAETDMFIVEGPTMDNEGNLYFSPIAPKEDVSLVALDRETGKRLWAKKGRGAGGGAPLILNDPENPGKQIIYSGTYDKAMAIRPDGSVIWEVDTGLINDRTILPDPTHNFGLNYVPQADALLGVFIDGHIYALDRKTGKPLLSKPYMIPGAPTAPNEKVKPSPFITKRVDESMRAAFGPIRGNVGRFSRVLDVLFGGGTKIANYYAVDPNTGRIFVAATSPDEEDGKKDGVSDFGALYALELVKSTDGTYMMKEINHVNFVGGTGASPALTQDGLRVYTSDNFNNVLAYDRDLNEIWKLNVGEQVAASITVASENNELFAVTAGDLIKIKDTGSSAHAVWRARDSMDMYSNTWGQKNLNLLTALVTANGVAVSMGVGYKLKNMPAPLNVGYGLLDRETGAVRYYTEGPEESVSVTGVGPDGGMYIAHSPIRRSVTQAIPLIGNMVNPLIGGIARYKPIRNDLLVRDASCAAADRLENGNNVSKLFPESAAADIRHAQILINQSKRALDRAVLDKDLSRVKANAILSLLSRSETKLSIDTLTDAKRDLESVCNKL